MNSSRTGHGSEATPNPAAAAQLAQPACLPYLLEAQNEDGGWGFSRGLESRVEPTSWALIALSEILPGGSGGDACSRGFNFLERLQLADGSWPSAPSQSTGSWVTSLACWAFLAGGDASPNLMRGVEWLRRDLPGDAQFWSRSIRAVVALTFRKRVNAQNESYWGWSWTGGTASWVEPTAHALIVLQAAPAGPASPNREKRQELAQKMLYDRMCPGGGWNCGNPSVYGVPGEPLVGPTVWALLALRAYPDRNENRISLNWLAQNWMKIQSPASLALAHIALEAYGMQIREIRSAIETLCERNEFAWTLPVAAWTALATSGKMNWINLGYLPKAS